MDKMRLLLQIGTKVLSSDPLPIKKLLGLEIKKNKKVIGRISGFTHLGELIVELDEKKLTKNMFVSPKKEIPITRISWEDLHQEKMLL